MSLPVPPVPRFCIEQGGHVRSYWNVQRCDECASYVRPSSMWSEIDHEHKKKGTDTIEDENTQQIYPIHMANWYEYNNRIYTWCTDCERTCLIRAFAHIARFHNWWAVLRITPHDPLHMLGALPKEIIVCITEYAKTTVELSNALEPCKACNKKPHVNASECTQSIFDAGLASGNRNFFSSMVGRSYANYTSRDALVRDHTYVGHSVPLKSSATSSESTVKVGASRHPCNYCYSRAASKQCSQCKQVCYCDRSCQRADWKRHKQECVPHDE